MIPLEALRNGTRVIVHRDCPDGTASAMILHDVLPDAEIVAVAYGPERDAIEPGPADLFCDMTPPPAKVDAFVAAGAIVLDHHRGARELVERFGERGVYADADEEPGVSGAVLAFHEVFLQLKPAIGNIRKAIQLFVTLAGVRDCWLRDHPWWHEACAQAEVLVFRPLEHWLGSHRPFLTEAEAELGAALWQRKLRRAREIAETGCMRLGASAVIFNDAPKPDSRISDVAEAMRKLDPEVKLVVGFFYSLQSERPVLEFHLRSSPGAELTARQIAVANGGGGHDHAAGFVLSSPRLCSCGCTAPRWHDRGPSDLFQEALHTARQTSWPTPALGET